MFRRCLDQYPFNSSLYSRLASTIIGNRYNENQCVFIQRNTPWIKLGWKYGTVFQTHSIGLLDYSACMSKSCLQIIKIRIVHCESKVNEYMN